MPTYPLPTLAATVDAAGISAPAYPDILESLKANFRTIYGADAYLEPDSQDGQWLAVVAAAIRDCNSTAIAIYNSMRPTGATGAGLSSAVKINGIARLVATNSTADVRIVGTAGTAITGGLVGDAAGNQWSIPDTIIPNAGEITVTATAQKIGAVAATANTITRILTPTRGWQSATNPTAAAVGAPVETDAALRQRQARSVALPSQAIVDGIYAGIADLDGVTELKIYENDTGTTDGNGIPGHSLAAVVSGGSAAAIAREIFQRKPPGCGTYGTTTQAVTDSRGVPANISFSRPTAVPITVEIDIEAGAGYVDATGTALVQAVADYINALAIGDHVRLSRLFTPANSGGNTYTVAAIRLARDGGIPTAASVAIAWNELAGSALTDITLSVL